MENSEILQILVDYNFWKKDLYTGIKRPDILSKLEKLLKIKEIVVVSGIRRSGKSTLLSQFCKSLIESGVRKEDILITNFEDYRFRNLNLDLLNKIYELYLTELNPKPKHYVVLDEIQTVSGWEKFARYLHENKRVNVFVTGSNSKLLASEYSTVLAGRHVDMHIYPLSFHEFLEFNSLHIKNKLDLASNRYKIKRLLTQYFKWGGFPKVTITKGENGKRTLLETYFRDIVIKDIILRHKIKETGKLEELAKYYLTNISALQSFNKVRKMLNLNLDTVERFSHYLSDTFLLYFVKKFAYSKKEQILNPKKVYCTDNGIINIAGFTMSKDLGKLAENTVFNKLNKENNEIYYWKDRKGEIDFLIKEKLKVAKLIQVCWNIEDENTKKRETTSLLRAMKKFKLKQGLIITGNKEGEETIDGKKIKYIPLWKWLLVKK